MPAKVLVMNCTKYETAQMRREAQRAKECEYVLKENLLTIREIFIKHYSHHSQQLQLNLRRTNSVSIAIYRARTESLGKAITGSNTLTGANSPPDRRHCTK